MRYILILCFLFLNFSTPKREALKLEIIEIKQDSLVEKSLNIIKKYEDFSSEQYELFGHYYKGYGHLVSKNDSISINKVEADSILKLDFERSLIEVMKLRLPISKKRTYTLALFVFNCGIGTLKNSKLLKLIRANEHDSIVEKCYLSYVYCDSVLVPRMLFRRIEEINL